MIVIENGGSLGGMGNLFRIHGSAAYKVVLPALGSTALLIAYDFISFRGRTIFLQRHAGHDDRETIVQHPFAIGAFIAFFSFLLSFRLNFAYDRYWEGATAVHLMMSKWTDCAMCMGAFHSQSAQYKGIQPPTFGGLDGDVTEDRIEGRERESISKDDSHDPSAPSVGSRPRFYFEKRRQRRMKSAERAPNKPLGKSINCSSLLEETVSNIPIPQRFQLQLLQPHTDACNDTQRFMPLNDQHYSAHKRCAKQPKPSLFLQETAHLISLLNAVAFSTLRNDIDQAASPVTPYVPGQPWPCVDPDHLATETKREYGESNTFWAWFNFCFGLNRSTKRRTLYNAARPFGVLGGVSDAEIALLQSARGPYAKVSLVTMWLQEFISRESLSGSTGDVPGPFLSRLYQFISDGMGGYNQARKVAYIPYPFVGAQITAFFSLAIIFIFPLLFTNFVTNQLFACVLNFFTVLCFLGVHEVARELENPFQNVPNDLPLTTFQAQFNETLVTLYAGYHPDGWWEVLPETELSEGED